ncbi:DUF6166 domain-containing protein [Cupriavidus taiwanensis]|jgi:hypothetical protein|uniref:DUF6166 domain-containing protein n=1 Tax=Cupriavidus taiwanensis TaxID=164546 RepID=UPI002541ED52|nr:DUF6166 domain-containing protein [Cupriavidus taiwanensis]MDK3022702.1 DUF6166 domain-containing protein [Cupriavidus taiwanensis]
MKTYTGDRTIDGVKVHVDGRPLPDKADIQRYTDMGFEWGYEGQEPRQLAFALLFDHTDNAGLARSSSEAFMRAMVANLSNEWHLTSESIEEFLRIACS